ncbi:efflux RND transporter permease subunit [Ornithobacterium rhinotracheale]|uniref:Efflux RND transporter permease subunit n=1 Tax=Ornithobacterium rhinotracheale TaxID=28251 RepID=A0A3R6AVL5_ORNRH|nr:efflux RND transporter permease subunit [Ornithobacterium rhinotracheale]QAR31564.1 efflux RND transporter permease subunit [Ornithobacterium rhinotracheale]
MKLAEISIKRPSIVIVMLALALIAGLYSYKQLSYELVPNIETKVVTVATVYAGASPAEIENTVTKKIEDAVSTLENVKKIQAKSYESLSVVIIEFTNNANVDNALNDAQRKINAIRSELPEGVKEPSLSKFSLSDLPIMSVGITSSLSNTDLYDLVKDQIQPQFSRIPGVSTVNIVGGNEREIRVSLDPARLEGYGITVPQVQQILLASNMDFPTGNLKTRQNSTLIRLSGKFKSVQQMRDLVIASHNGMNIKLSDIADVQETQKEVEKLARINQDNTLLLQIQKQTDANAVEVSALVKEKMKKIEEQYQAQGVKIQLANDTSEFTLTAANNVIHDLYIAVALVAFVMLFFLHSLRNALMVMVSIPASLIATFIGLFVLGYTLNLMSLLALSLVVGILVDDAIVVIENIHRHMEMGKNKVRAAYDGASEIGFTVTAITTVIVVVFLPIAMSSGLVSDIVRQFCVTVVIATVLSLLMSFTVVPWLFSRFGKLEHISDKNIFGKIILSFEKGLKNFTQWVTAILKWCLGHKIITIVVTGVMFFSIIPLFMFGFVGTEFFPGVDKGEFIVQIEMNKDASLEETNFMTQKAEDYILKQPEVKTAIATVGQVSGGMGASQSTAYKSEVSVQLRDDVKRDESEIYAAKLKRQLQQELVGAKIKTIPVGLMGANQAPIQLVVTGDNLDDAMEFAVEAMEILKGIDGTSEVELSVEDGTPEINVEVDRDKMASLGLNVATVGQTMRTAFAGNTDNKFRQGQNEYDINLQFQEGSRENIDDVKNLIFVNSQGQQIKLMQFADVRYASGPSLLERNDKAPSVTVNSQVVGRSSGAISQEWSAKLAEIQAKPGVSYKWSGMQENQQEGFGTLGVALLAAIMLVYMVMVVLYDDFAKPFIVLLSVPLSFIGAIWALALTNMSLNIFTILGLIMLIGLVAKNAILLVDFANHRVAKGEDTITALIQANQARLRPILMTTIAMVFGMIPIALATGGAAKMNNGLAIVIIGGLLSSLFLTLVIVPVVYLVFDLIGKRLNKNKQKPDYAALMKADYDHKNIKEEYEF